MYKKKDYVYNTYTVHDNELQDCFTWVGNEQISPVRSTEIKAARKNFARVYSALAVKDDLRQFYLRHPFFDHKCNCFFYKIIRVFERR